MVKRFIAASILLLSACGGAPQYPLPPAIEGGREDLLQLAMPRLHAATGLVWEDIAHLYAYEASPGDTAEACGPPVSPLSGNGLPNITGGCAFADIGVIVINEDLSPSFLENVMIHEVMHALGLDHVGTGIMNPSVGATERIDSETLYHLCQKVECAWQKAEFRQKALIPPAAVAPSCSHATL